MLAGCLGFVEDGDGDRADVFNEPGEGERSRVVTPGGSRCGVRIPDVDAMAEDVGTGS